MRQHACPYLACEGQPRQCGRGQLSVRPHRAPRRGALAAGRSSGRRHRRTVHQGLHTQRSATSPARRPIQRNPRGDHQLSGGPGVCRCCPSLPGRTAQVRVPPGWRPLGDRGEWMAAAGCPIPPPPARRDARTNTPGHVHEPAADPGHRQPADLTWAVRSLSARTSTSRPAPIVAQRPQTAPNDTESLEQPLTPFRGR
jgi:hypothetical protein